MKLNYIATVKRQYPSLGKEFPNATNEIEVDDNIGKILLTQKVGKTKLWKEVKRIKKSEGDES